MSECHSSKMGYRDRDETKSDIIYVESKPSENQSQQQNCCGIKCVWTTNQNNNCECDCQDCRQCCRECANNMPPFSWSCCFTNTLSIACYVTIIVLSIYWAAVTGPRIDDCRDFTAYERHDCLNDMNGALVGFAFAFCAMFYSAFRIIWCFMWLCDEQFRQPHAPYECTDCRPNRPLCMRIGRMVATVMFFLGIFLFVYCVQFIEDCRNDDDVCKTYKQKHLYGIVVGFAFSIPLTIFGFLLQFSKQ